MKKISISLCVALLYTTTNYAEEISATIYATSKPKVEIGNIVFRDTKYGLLISPSVTGLPPGAHGFHLHQHADCSDAGMKAQGHYDPEQANSHQGPYGKGHLGDLPVLFVTDDSKANTPLLAPRLKTSDLRGLAVMIHAGGDNYTDIPPLGGGGARIGCGIIKSDISTGVNN